MNTTDGSTKWFSPGQRVRAAGAGDEVFTVVMSRLGADLATLMVDVEAADGDVLSLFEDEVEAA